MTPPYLLSKQKPLAWHPKGSVFVLSHPFLLCDPPVYTPAQLNCFLCCITAPLAPRPSPFIKCFEYLITLLLVYLPLAL